MQKRSWASSLALAIFVLFIYAIGTLTKELLTYQKKMGVEVNSLNKSLNALQHASQPKINIELLKKTESLENVPWNNIFESLEISQSKFKHIYLISTDFNVAKKEILISGKTDKPDNLLSFIKEFSTHDLFYEVNLLNQDKSSAGETEYPLSFNLVIKWH